jgi:hypothetical protein
VRRARPDELDAVVALAGTALGWRAGDADVELFRWKHLDNPFGPSPAWVAEVDGELAGFRTYLRWRWRRGREPSVSAVRAVDTATHPDHQGRGIFRALTMGSLAELADDGVAFVFNTPNAQSRPGYLAMGWRQLGRVPVAVRPHGLGGVRRMLGARQAAEKWSTPTEVGEAAPAVFADHAATERLLAAIPPSARLATERSPAHLAWRYRLPALHYRCLPVGDRIEDGLVVFRLRDRGSALEATICEVLLPAATARRRAGLVRAVLAATGADYAIGTRASLPAPAAVPLPRQGPILTWREVGAVRPARLADFQLALGDVELF